MRRVHDTEQSEIPLNLPTGLRQLVQSALNDYFTQLDGHKGSDLYALVLGEVEPPLIRTTLEHCAHNQTRAAQLLGLSRSTLRKKMQHYGIE